jgi:hypothetical protein
VFVEEDLPGGDREETEARRAVAAQAGPEEAEAEQAPERAEDGLALTLMRASVVRSNSYIAIYHV